jgi:hypothetical protein
MIGFKCMGMWSCLAFSTLLEMMQVVIPNRGGARQRQKRAREESAAPSGHSPLGTGLLIRWGEGQLSAADVQNVAQLAVQSGASDEEVVFLSKIGAAGNQIGNCSRDLKTKFLKGIGIPDPLMVAVPLYNKSDRTSTVEAEVGIFLPHEWFACLDCSYPHIFKLMFGPQQAQEWWQQQKAGNPKFHKHPMLKKNNWQQLALPFLLHADGAQFQERDSLLTVSMKALLFQPGEVKDTHLLLCAVPKSITTPETWGVLWQVLAWSFEVLLKGKFPTKDWEGRPFPAGSSRAAQAGQPLVQSQHFGVLWGIIGDLDFFHKDLGGPGHNAGEFCWRCRCNRNTLPWTDFRPGALWRQTMLTPQEVLVSDVFDCPLFGKAGISPLMLMLDIMHTSELGVVLHVVANILYTIAYMDEAPTPPATAVDHLWVRLQEIYAELGLERKHSSLTVKNICDPEKHLKDYPHLRKFKASEVKGLLRAVAKLCRERGAPDTMHKQMLGSVEALVGIYDILEDERFKWHIDSDRYADLVMLKERFLVQYSWLAKDAMQQGRLMWSIVNKFHFMEHMVDQAKWENVKLFSAYSGEDFVGRISRIAHMCLPGKPTHLIFAALQERYSISSHLVFTRLST